MTTVTLRNALFSGRAIEGTFECLGSFRPDAWVNRPRDGKIKIRERGCERSVWVNNGDFEIHSDTPSASTPAKRTDGEILAKIEERFEVMDLMADGVIGNNIRSLIISGAPGIGKTFSLEKKMNAAADDMEIESFVTIKGRVSPIGLYVRLYESRNPGNVVLLDDVDVFSDENTLNLLKAVLDTGEKRIVSWATASSYLDERDIPTSFEFEGSVVFITNTNLDAAIEGNSKIVPHLQALLSRSVYLDLAVHSNHEIMLWIERVINKTTMMQDLGLTNGQVADALEWLKANTNALRSVSLRTCLYLADFMKTSPTEWQKIAEVTMIKPKFNR